MPPARASAVDTIRAVALIGICIVNVPFMALPLEEALGYLPARLGPDRITQSLTAILFQSKFFLLFSLLFGWGVHTQMTSAARRATPFGPLYLRRLGGLAVLGTAHATLVFTGDILLLYALLGLLLWPLRDAPARTLLKWALAMIPFAVTALLLAGILIDDPAALIPEGTLGGSFMQATAYRLSAWPSTFAFLCLFQGPMAFGAFAAGLAAAKTDFFGADSPGRAKLARWALICAPLGLLINVVIALAPSPDSAALLAIPLAAPLLALTWLQLILWADAHLRIPPCLILAGRNSATAYILQGIIAGAIFGSYGLGLYGQLGLAALLPLSLVIALLAIKATALLAKRWGRGPLEMLLRWVTHGNR